MASRAYTRAKECCFVFESAARCFRKQITLLSFIGVLEYTVLSIIILQDQCQEKEGKEGPFKTGCSRFFFLANLNRYNIHVTP